MGTQMEERREERAESIRDTLNIASKELEEAEQMMTQIMNGLRAPESDEERAVPLPEPRDMETQCRDIERRICALRGRIGFIRELLLG